MFANLIKATLAFLATNMDDLFLLVTFLMVAVSEAADKKRKDIIKVFIGQILGFIVIVLLADLGGLGVRMLSKDFIAGLGAIPLFMGFEIFWTERPARREHQKKSINQHVVSVGFVFITILADGGDNLGVYIPFFSTLNNTDLILVNLYLVFLICLWCGLGLWFTHFKDFETFFHKYGENTTAIILIVLGAALIYQGLN